MNAITGCAAITPPRSALAPVARAVRERLAYEPQWEQSPSEVEAEAQHSRTSSILSRPLDTASVVELTLLESPSVRAALADVSVAQADAR
jgi:hypothetical protein